MHVYLGIKYHEDGANRFRIETTCGVLEEIGHNVTCVFRDQESWGARIFPPTELMTRTFEMIDNSERVLIDLTEKGVGLGIEASYTRAKDKRVLTIAQAGSGISARLPGISTAVVP